MLGDIGIRTGGNCLALLLCVCSPAPQARAKQTPPDQAQRSTADSVASVGPYFGQEPPGMVPEVFAPDILSRVQPEWAFCAEFGPDLDEFYFSRTDVERNIDQILVMRRENDNWSAPEVASFNAPYDTHDSRISPDGRLMFFRSRRPLPGNSGPEEAYYAWFAERNRDGWSAPQPVLCDGAPLRTGHLGISGLGRIYFSQRSAQNVGEADIYRAMFHDGACTAPENLGPIVNTRYLEGDAYISPDERMLIVSVWNRPENSGDSDLYISYRHADGSWSPLTNLGDPINTFRNENCATLSPDGKYFFYVGVDAREERAKIDTYWVDARILDRHRTASHP